LDRNRDPEKISVAMLGQFENGNRNLSDDAWDAVTRAVAKLDREKREAMSLKQYAQTVHSPTIAEYLMKYALAPRVTVANYAAEQLVSMVREREDLLGVADHENRTLRRRLRFSEEIAEGRTDHLVTILQEHIKELELKAALAVNREKEIADLRRLVGLRTEAIVKTEEADALQSELEQREAHRSKDDDE